MLRIINLKIKKSILLQGYDLWFQQPQPPLQPQPQSFELPQLPLPPQKPQQMMIKRIIQQQFPLPKQLHIWVSSFPFTLYIIRKAEKCVYFQAEIFLKFLPFYLLSQCSSSHLCSYWQSDFFHAQLPWAFSLKYKSLCECSKREVTTCD